MVYIEPEMDDDTIKRLQLPKLAFIVWILKLPSRSEARARSRAGLCHLFEGVLEQPAQCFRITGFVGTMAVSGSTRSFKNRKKLK